MICNRKESANLEPFIIVIFFSLFYTQINLITIIQDFEVTRIKWVINMCYRIDIIDCVGVLLLDGSDILDEIAYISSESNIEKSMESKIKS